MAATYFEKDIGVWKVVLLPFHEARHDLADVNFVLAENYQEAVATALSLVDGYDTWPTLRHKASNITLLSVERLIGVLILDESLDLTLMKKQNNRAKMAQK